MSAGRPAATLLFAFAFLLLWFYMADRCAGGS